MSLLLELVLLVHWIREIFWHHEYLLSPREQSKDLYKSSFQNIIKVDDVVLVRNPVKPRLYWYLGRVLEFLKGDDDCVRFVTVRRSDEGMPNHSLKHLYSLELSLTQFHQAGNPLGGTAEATVVSTDQHLDQVGPVGCG